MTSEAQWEAVMRGGELASSATSGPFDLVIDQVAQRVAERIRPQLPQGNSSPWLSTDEAITYCRLPEGTFRKLVAAGRIRHNGTERRHIFHRDELDDDVRRL
jgi:hypothetical protein